MLEQAIAFGLSKGGTGKSSTAANVAAGAARGGWRTLMVDLDPQNNLAIDFGAYEAAAQDGGESLLRAAMIEGTELAVIRNVRPGLDLVPGGPSIDTLTTMISLRVHGSLGALETVSDFDRARARLDAATLSPADEFDAISNAIATIADRYDLIVIDTPPTDIVLTLCALSTARFLVVPTKGDSASLLGLDRLAQRFMAVRHARNPDLELLGVVLFDFGSNEKRLVAEARVAVEEALGGLAPVFDSVIRSSRRAAVDMRDAGMVAVEYGEQAAAAPNWIEARKTGVAHQTFSSSATQLAEDYVKLTNEILGAMSTRIQAARHRARA